MTTLSPYEAAATKDRGSRHWIVTVFWIIALLADAFAVFVVYVGMTQANGAPQEASVAALGCFIAIAPYVFARAVEEIGR